MSPEGMTSSAPLEAGIATPTKANQIALTGGGPSGVVLSEGNRVALVLTRFDNSISVVDLDRRAETAHVAMFNPEPASVTAGRTFLYDASTTSTFGTPAASRDWLKPGPTRRPARPHTCASEPGVSLFLSFARRRRR